MKDSADDSDKFESRCSFLSELLSFGEVGCEPMKNCASAACVSFWSVISAKWFTVSKAAEWASRTKRQELLLSLKKTALWTPTNRLEVGYSCLGAHVARCPWLP